MSGPKHTPLPWRQAGVAFEIKDATGETVGFTLGAVDAALIVRAVNAHADLLAALESLSREYESLWSATTDGQFGKPNSPAYKRALSVLADARGA
jgi:hypothetical protein